jgi:6-phosphogluconate dehydrogenase
MSDGQAVLGMIGLGVMGRNYALNLRDHGFRVAGYDRDEAKTAEWAAESGGDRVGGGAGLAEWVRLLRKPRAVMLLVPAGPPVDAVIRDLLPVLEPGDLVIDSGNSHFKDTELRERTLAEKGLLYLGVGISGGADGARYGPSLMPGGPAEAYERVRAPFEATAARADGEPCAAYLGPGGAGHYVKMVHNGIEYGLLQLIAESYDLLERGLGLGDADLHGIYREWNRGELNSFLLEITADIFQTPDPKTGRPLIDVILDEARQKGTGKWASENALELQVPIPTIDAAVAARNLSMDRERRLAVHGALPADPKRLTEKRDAFVADLRNALYAAMILTYTQGMALLQAGSPAYGYGLRLETVARIWSGGCIIRAALLGKIRSALLQEPPPAHLLLDPPLGEAIFTRRESLRRIACAAAAAGIPAPAFASALAYFDSYRSAWLPANLIQAQRDYFGAHTYERIDEKGVFHTEWNAD